MGEMELRELRRIFEQVQEELSRFKEEISILNSDIESNRLISDEQVSRLEDLLRIYRKDSVELLHLGAKLSAFTDNCDLGIMSEALDKLEAEVHERDALNSLISDYFRLTAEAQDVKQALEESKQLLLERRSNAVGEQLKTVIHPFEVVVNNTRSNGERLSSDDFALIQREIGTEVARAVDRGDLLIDESVDITIYLNENSSDVTAISETDTTSTDSKDIMHESETAVPVDPAASNNSAVTEEPGISKEPDDAAGDSEEDPIFDGIIRNLTVDCKDTPASEFKVNKFTSLLKEKPTAAKAMMIFGQLKLVSKEPMNDAASELFGDALDIAPYLEKHGYVTTVVVNVDGKGKEYYSLTSKGWACYSRQESAKYLKRTHPRYYLEPPCRYSMPWVAKDAAYAACISDYVLAGENPYFVVITQVQFKNGSHIYGVLPLANEQAVSICAGLFEEGNIRDEIDYLCDVRFNSDTDATIVIAASVEDIPRLSSALHFDDESFQKTYYTTLSDPHRFFLGDGKETTPYFIADFEDGDSDEEDNEADGESEREGSQVEATEKSSEGVPTLTGINHDTAPLADNRPETSEKPEALTNRGQLQENNGNETPEESDLELHYLECALDAISGNRFPEALTMLRAGGAHSELLQKTYHQFAYALDDPALEGEFSVPIIQSVFDKAFGQDEAYDTLAISAFLRVYFETDAQNDVFNIRNCPTILDGNSLYREVPSVKELVFKLNQVFERSGRGYDKEILNSILNKDNLQSRVEHFSKAAANLLGANLSETTIMNRQVKEAKTSLFGSGSKLRLWLEIAAANQRINARTVADQTREFLNIKSIGSLMVECTDEDLNDDAINALIDEAWQDAWHKLGKSRSQKEPAVGSARNSMFNRVSEILAIVISWASATIAADQRTLEDRTATQLESGREMILQLMKDSTTALDSMPIHGKEFAAACSTLKETLKELSGRLENGYNSENRRYYYIGFLLQNRIELDGRYIPFLEDEFDELAPWNLCSRIEKHIATENESFETAIERIFRPANESDGYDFGSARLIQQYLSDMRPEIPWPDYCVIDDGVKAFRNSLEQRDSEFAAQIEMAESYGWIEDREQTIRISADIQKRRQHYDQTENFGFYCRTMQKYLKILRRGAEQHKTSTMERLRSIKLNDTSDQPIFKEIDALIKDDMYTVADNYMDLYEKGQTIIPQSRLLPSADDPLELFIRNYSGILSKAREANQKSMADAFSKQYKGENQQIRTGKLLLDSWPRSTGNAMQKIKTLFVNLGLPVNRVEPVGSETTLYLMSFDYAGNEINYPHPIGSFGTRMLTGGLYVRLMFGNKKDEDMMTSLQKSITAGTDKPTIIIADTPMSLPDRRKLAKKIKTESQSPSPYLILDRVLVLFLAEQPMLERWKIFLRCALPFQFYNPYAENSNVDIPPEMFFGRREELQSVIDPSGANIVYGGRQLGKTALLQRARKQVDNRELGSWAVFMDIKHYNCDDAAQAIFEKLINEGFLVGDPNQLCSWKDLSRALISRINGKPAVSRFLLLLDEADALLKSDEATRFKTVDMLKQIQSETGDRFKFVLAGLHNVMRFNSKATAANSGLTHLGAITIKPLSYLEASELLEVPLSYLGFRLLEDQKRLIALILSSTNYYPGLIQFYASRLVKSVNTKNYGDSNQRPPFQLDESQIRNLLREPDFLNNIKDKYMSTLGIDSEEEGYYKILAYLLADCYYLHENAGSEGVSAKMIRETAVKFDINLVRALSQNQIEVLMSELEQLNILRCITGSTPSRYIFNRDSFRHMLGGQEEVEDYLLEVMVKEAQ